MRFYGILDPNSAVHKLWKSRRAVGGTLDHVQFTIVGLTYQTAELTEVQIENFNTRQDKAVMIAMMSTSPDQPAERPRLDDEEDDDTTDDDGEEDTSKPSRRRRQRL